jgi:integrase
MKSNRYLQVRDRARRRIRGLWKRNDSFYVQTTVPDPLTGLKKVTLIRLPTATDIDSAKTEAGNLRKKIADGESVHGRHGPTFAEYREHYIKTAVGKKPKTLTCEKSFLKKWEKYFKADTKIGAITKQNVFAFRVQLKDDGYSARTINLHVITLRNLFKLAKMEGYVKTLPTDGVVQMKIVQTEKKLLSNEQIDAVCAESLANHKRSGQQFADFIRLLAFSGGRTSEVLKLTWGDVDFQRKVLVFTGTHTKNSQTRRVDFNPKLESHLKSMHARKTTDSLFPSSRTENPVTSFKTILRKIRTDLGMPYLTNHLLRHYFISKSVMAGIDFMTIAEWVGHQDGGVLIGSTYGHLNSEHTERMAQKLTFEAP